MVIQSCSTLVILLVVTLWMLGYHVYRGGVSCHAHSANLGQAHKCATLDTYREDIRRVAAMLP